MNSGPSKIHSQISSPSAGVVAWRSQRIAVEVREITLIELRTKNSFHLLVVDIL